MNKQNTKKAAFFVSLHRYLSIFINIRQSQHQWAVNNKQNKTQTMKPQHAAQTDKRYIVPFILITLLFFLWRFARSILDVLNKHFQNELAISVTQSGWFQVTTYLVVP